MSCTTRPYPTDIRASLRAVRVAWSPLLLRHTLNISIAACWQSKACFSRILSNSVYIRPSLMPTFCQSRGIRCAMIISSLSVNVRSGREACGVGAAVMAVTVAGVVECTAQANIHQHMYLVTGRITLVCTCTCIYICCF